MTTRRSLALAAVTAIATIAVGDRTTAQSADNDVIRLIEPIRQEHRLPALGAAIVTSRGVVASGVTGTRKAGADVAATVDDRWHLGSDTKAMTAVILATFVEQGRLTWETRIDEVFRDLAPKFPPDFRAITVTQLLTHYAGLPANVAWREIERTRATLPAQRVDALKRAAATTLTSRPGTKFEYSNLGYVVAGAIAERVGGKPWEELMREIVFTPLGMATCGFGGLGTLGTIDQPWPHTADGRPTSLNGPDIDNAAVLGPAGTVHCSIADWSKFIADQLRGARGERALLKPDTYKALHAPRFGGTYAFGWGVTSRVWSGGTVLQHSGSNTMNFSVVWVAPLRDVAVLAVTNQAGNAAVLAADQAVAAMIRLQEKR
jgi:CubicO group peptidase (beta-lactamase class C family)